MKKFAYRAPRSPEKNGLSFVVLALASMFLLLCWFGVQGVRAQADQKGAGGGAAVPPKAADTNKAGSDVNKPSETPKTNDQAKPPESVPPQAPASSQSKLSVVEEEKHTFWELVEGQSATVPLEVTTDEKDGVNIARISFEPIQAKQTPAEATQVRVIGPAGGYPGPLKPGDKLTISLVFPPHRAVVDYQANLTYTTAEAPAAPKTFHTATVQVGMMNRWAAALIAGGFCVVIILLTFIVSKISKKELNFFQSPDGGYSVSKFQIWIWTLVIVFSYSYLFLWRDGNIEITANTWALLGISVASTGIAKVIAVTKDEG